MPAQVILVEATPRLAADGSPVAVRLAGGGAHVPYRYGQQDWRAGIDGLPKAIASLDFDGEQLGGGGVAQALELSWSPGSSAALTDLAALFWTDAAIAVRIGPEGDAVPPIVNAGLVMETTVDGGALKIALADQAVDLKRVLLTDRFAGTGGIEGPAAIATQIKPRAWGQCFNVIGRVLDSANNIWCFGDPYRPWLAFDQVRDKGAAPAPAALTLLGWQGSPAATFAALQATPATAGGGVLCPSIACVKWWAQPAGDLHADIRGETAGGYVETAPEICARLVAARSTLTFADGEVAAAAAARPAACGVLVDSDSATANDTISDLLAGVSLSWMIANGGFVFRRWEWTASTRIATSHRVTRQKTYKPVTARKLGYRRNWAPMARGDLAGIVLATDVLYDNGTPVTTAIATAATTATWTGVSDPTGTKPADNATVGATVGGNLKDSTGRVLTAAEVLNPAIALQPDGTLVATIAGAPTVLGKVAIPDLGAATDASRRQIEADLASLSGAVAQLTAGQALVQNVFRDAGLYTDPASGIAKLYAVESRAEQITNLSVALNAQLATISLKADVSYVKSAILAAQLPGQAADLSAILVRLTSAEANINGLSATVQLKADATVVTGIQGTVTAVQQSLDALNATVASKASQTIVDAQGARLTLAEQTLSAMDGASIAQSVTASRRAVTDADAIGATTILDLLNSAQNAQAAQDGIASARQELGARVSSAFDAVATLTTNLAVQIGAVNAAAAIESAARISADQASASTLATYQATVAGNFAAANTAIGVVSTKADATAQALTDFKVQTASNIATLTTQQTAQATATSAVSQSLTDFKAATATNLAAIDVRFTTASDATKAVAQQVADLTASTNTALGSVNTKVSAAATKADATAQSLADYQTSTNANLGSISQKLSTTTDQTQGLASAVTTLTAGANVRQNLQLNGGFENGTTGLTASQAVAIADDPFGGRLLHWEYNDTTVVLMPAVNVVPGEPYTIGFDANVRVGSGALRVDASTFSGQNGTGQVTYDRYSSAGFGDGTTPDVRRSFTFTAPAGCASIQLRLISYNIANPGSIWIRRIKVEHGAAPATAYSADTTIADTASGASAANASINQLASVVAGNAQAVAGQITTINTTLNGQSNTLTQYGQSINGLGSKWGVEFNANGAISGFALNNGGGRTDATFVVDNFRIVQPNGGNNRQVFSIAVDGTIQMPAVRVNTLEAGAVTYDGMQMGAAQKCAFQSTGGDFAIGQNQTANVVSVTFVKEDASSVLKLVMFANCYSPDDLQFVGTILLDGNSVQSARVNIVLDTQTSQGEMPVTPFMFLSGVGAGQHTVAFTIQNTNVKNLDLTVRGGATLEVTELRKGSIGSSTGSGSSIVSSGSSSGGSSSGSSSGGGGGGTYSGGNVKQQ